MDRQREGSSRHGGNHGRTDKGEAENAKAQASLDTDIDSRRGARDQDKAEGHTSGKE